MKTTIEDIKKAAERERIASERFAAIGMANIAGRSDEDKAKINASYRAAEAEMMRAVNVRREAQNRYARGV